MIKIKISYADQRDKEKVMQALRQLKITKISKEQVKKGHRNIYIDVE